MMCFFRLIKIVFCAILSLNHYPERIDSLLKRTQQRMAKIYPIYPLMLLALANSQIAFAETMSLELSDAGVVAKSSDTIEIEGDKLELMLDRKMRAIGNAAIHQENKHVYGDVIEYDTQNDELKVKGNAKIELGDSVVSGSEINMRLEDSVGNMPNASILLDKKLANHQESSKSDKPFTQPQPLTLTQSDLLNSQTSLTDDPRLYVDNHRTKNISDNPFESKFTTSRGDAENILFEGQDKKRLKNARYTTCEIGNDDWYIKASELELNDYTESGVARNARVEFKGMPLLYTPWMSFSFNNQRKSGLLSPTIGTTSRSGFEISTPYYINIAPDMDATVGLRYLGKRGVQLQGEFRYLDERYSGIDNLEYLNKDNLSGDNRYYANLSHQHNFSEHWSGGYHIEKVSDDRYFSEMSTRIISTSRVNLPQEARLDYTDDVWRFNAMAQKYQTLDSTSYPYERLPQLTLTGNKDWGDFTTELFSQYAYFDRHNNAPMATTGNRIVAYPSISIPLSRSYGYITPKLGVHMTSYSVSDNNHTVNGINSAYNSENRTLPIFSLDSGVYFDRTVNIIKNSYTQTLEPRLFYVYTPYDDQSKLPVFDSGLADINLTTLFTENQFTGSDRINNANQLSVAITSRMIDDNTGIERFSATVAQRYYFSDQKVSLPGSNTSDSNSSDIIAAITARLSNKWNLDAFWQYNTDTSSMKRNNILARYNPEPGKLLNFGYRYTDELLEQVNISGQWPLGRGWYGVGRYNYSLRDGNLIESLAGIEYDAGCWQARSVVQRVETATANANYALFFQLELGGIASIGANPLNLLRRDIPGYLTSSEIPNTYRLQNYTP